MRQDKRLLMRDGEVGMASKESVNIVKRGQK